MYAELIYQDQREDMDRVVSFVEYLASFWNAEAVKKIQEIRNSSAKHKFKDNEEFEKELLSGAYKENKLLDAVIQNNKVNTEKNKKVTKIKSPTDLSEIYKTLGKFK